MPRLARLFLWSLLVASLMGVMWPERPGHIEAASAVVADESPVPAGVPVEAPDANPPPSPCRPPCLRGAPLLEGTVGGESPLTIPPR